MDYTKFQIQELRCGAILLQAELIIVILPFMPLIWTVMFLWIYWKFSRYPFRRVSHQFGIGLFLLLMALVSFVMASNRFISGVAFPEAIILLIVGFIVIIIDLSYNKLSKISGLGKLRKLKQLDLSYNQLIKVDGLENLKDLEELHLVENKLLNLNEIRKLSNLKVLDV